MATAKQLRNQLVKTAESYLGTKQGQSLHKLIINTFNKVKPDGWAMTYSAPWCAAFASACAIETFGVSKAKKYFPLSAIARKYGTTVKAIAAENKISNVNMIRVGQKLKITT